VQMVKNHAHYMCYPVCLWQCSVRAESVHAPCPVGCGRPGPVFGPGVRLPLPLLKPGTSFWTGSP